MYAFEDLQYQFTRLSKTYGVLVDAVEESRAEYGSSAEVEVQCKLYQFFNTTVAKKKKRLIREIYALANGGMQLKRTSDPLSNIT